MSFHFEPNFFHLRFAASMPKESRNSLLDNLDNFQGKPKQLFLARGRCLIPNTRETKISYTEPYLSQADPKRVIRLLDVVICNLLNLALCHFHFILDPSFQIVSACRGQGVCQNETRKKITSDKTNEN